MTRKSYIQLKDGSLMDKELYYKQESNAPMIMGDIKPYQSMVTGEEITSRSKHREHLRQHGMVEVGNEVNYFKQTQEAKREHSSTEIRQLREHIAQQVYQKFR